MASYSGDAWFEGQNLRVQQVLALTCAGNHSKQLAYMTPITSRCHFSNDSGTNWDSSTPSTIFMVRQNAGKYSSGELPAPRTPHSQWTRWRHNNVELVPI
jgi:hypothetical protein